MNTSQSMPWPSPAATDTKRQPAWWWMALRGLGAVERFGGRLGGAAVALLAAGGVVLAVTAFAFLLISEHRPLFGFMEPGYDPAAITAARVAEVATVALLGAFLIARFVARVPMPRW
jgi:hypothetical protein